MDNSATKSQQNSGDQPSVQPTPVQNVGSPSEDANRDNETQQPVVVNRGGIQVNLSGPQTTDSNVGQGDSSSTQPAPQQIVSSTSQDESVPTTTSPAAQQDEKPQEPQTAPQPVSSPRSKEQEPVPAPLPDVAKMTEAEIIDEEKEVEKELEAIIEKSPNTEKPDIPKEAQDAGVTHSGADIPHPAAPSGSVVLPMTFEEAKTKYDKYKWRNSVSWFAGLIVYHWKKLKAATPGVMKKED